MMPSPLALPDRSPPHDLEAEKGVLGSIFLLPDLFDDVLGTGLRVEDFYAPSHGILFAAMGRQRETGEPIDTTLIVERLKACGDFELVGMKAMIEIIQSVPTGHNAVHYAAVVRRHAQSR